MRLNEIMTEGWHGTDTEQPEEPYIDAHRSGYRGGPAIEIEMMSVPSGQRGQGIGRRYYEQWEAELPPDIHYVKLMAADTGSGLSNGFWERMGFGYMYDGDNLDYETGQWMVKGVNGHPTPEPVWIKDEDDDEDEPP